MKKEEIANILIMDEIKERFVELGVTETKLPANPLHIAKVWLNNDDEDEVNDYVNLGYEFEKGKIAEYADCLVLAAILDSLKQIKDQ